tara:strand:- start:2267 stop:2572 length:306 start_codon:yes stop_codon:yes gene_type:complete
MSSIRGMDNRDMVKVLRDKQRYDIAYNKDNTSNIFRKDIFRESPKDMTKLKLNKPVISMRGSDIKDQVLEGRKKAQYNKVNTPFMSYSQPVDTKITQGLYF